jgi:tellurium resistance protein TerD
MELMEKGAKVELTKGRPTLTLAEAGLGWDQMRGVATADLDAFLVEVNEDVKAANGEASLIYYGHKSNANNSVYVGPDNLTGEGEGDDEKANIKFAEVPANVKEVYVCVSIYQWEQKRQNFGQINNAYVAVRNADTKEEFGKYDLSEDMSNFTGIIAGKFRRESDGNWTFKAIGDGVKGGMQEIIARFGL